jgi:hypothetical protein
MNESLVGGMIPAQPRPPSGTWGRIVPTKPGKWQILVRGDSEKGDWGAYTLFPAEVDMWPYFMSRKVGKHVAFSDCQSDPS